MDIAAFFDHFEFLSRGLLGSEHLSAYLQAEDSAFVRFNHGRIRQPGQVRQATVRLELSVGMRHATADVSLGGERTTDAGRLGQALLRLRSIVGDIPEDPHFLLPEGDGACQDVDGARGAPLQQVLDDIAHGAQELDLVGILAHGPVTAAFADSAGRRHTWRRFVSNFDYSVYATGDKAFKQQVAGPDWDGALFQNQMADIRARLPLLERKPYAPTPGSYRAWLTPTALAEVLELLGWFSFSEKALRTQQSALLKLSRGEASLHPSVHLTEDTRHGTGPTFSPSGPVKSASVPLWREGRHAGALICPRTAREYGLQSDGCSDAEGPEALSLSPGEIDDREALQALGTGIWVSNLWYLNFSDRAACRMTGMTRFASFWVENGEIVAPLGVMRFDDTIYRMLGSELVGLGRTAQVMIDSGTWGRRSTRSTRLPGALIGDFRFTL